MIFFEIYDIIFIEKKRKGREKINITIDLKSVNEKTDERAYILVTKLKHPKRSYRKLVKQWKTQNAVSMINQYVTISSDEIYMIRLVK